MSERRTTDVSLLDHFTLWIKRVEDSICEHDRRYDERFNSMEKSFLTALQAQKEMFVADSISNQRSVAAALATQKELEVKNNEFRGQLKDQNETMIPRLEASQRFTSVDEKVEALRSEIAGLRESRSAGSSRETEHERIKSQTNRTTTMVVTIVVAVVGFIFAIIGVLMQVLK